MTQTRSFKTVLLGDASVGKSSIVMRFIRNTYSDAMETTVGASFSTQTIQLNDDTIKFDIWDTAGQERFQSLAPIYYRGASAAIVVFDQTSDYSFERAKYWTSKLQESANPNIVIILVANKQDMPNKTIGLDVSKTYADENGFLFIETSAKTGANVYQLFHTLACALKDTPSVDSVQPLTIAVGASDKEVPRKGCCGT
eukprot:GHVL01005393.1.p1 GENE.GHVL01005393.1~~GHVL01005393.1.p1  ORF type:complete len:198 (+),score=22.17 GHVL01005393.1:164-757(+)